MFCFYFKGHLDHCGSIDHVHQTVDNTYATIQPRHGMHGSNGGNGMGVNVASNNAHNSHQGRGMEPPPPQHISDFADYATLRNNRVPSVS